MKRRKIGKILTGTLAVGMLLSQGVPYNVLAQTQPNLNENGFGDSEQLMNLTPEQREAITKVQSLAKEGLQLSSDVNLDSSKTVSVIVEFKNKPLKVAVVEAAADGQVLSDDQAKSDAAADHSTFKSDLETTFKTKAGSYKITREYHTVFNGVALEVPANRLKDLVKSNAVQAIYSDEKVTVDPITEETPLSTEAITHGMAKERTYLGIDKLHKEGITGAGVHVAVIDTGIDYNHPDLKGPYKGGYDFVDNDADPMETNYDDFLKYKAANPTTTLKYTNYVTEHGTHVSGTIVGQGKADNPMATTGIAPDAELKVYRVLGPGGGGTTENVIAGMDRAVSDGADVINMSLGNSLNHPLYATSIAANNAVLMGVTTVIAAGNAGSGMYTLGAPAASSLALTIGASDVPDQVPTMNGKVGTATAKMRLLAKNFSDDISTLQGKNFKFVNIDGVGNETNYTGKTIDSNTVVLVQRGTTTLNDKILQAKLKGAAAILLWNNVTTEDYLPFYLADGTDFIPTFNLTNADGLKLKQQILSVPSATFSFSDLGMYTTPGDEIAGFSSRGPSRYNYDIKPEIVAPGVSVLSTVPSYMNSPEKPNDYSIAYSRLSGTSMATPFTAGVTALMLQANPTLQPADVKTILMNTADPLKKDYSVFEQGAGRIDPYGAIHSTMEIKVNDKTTSVVRGKEKQIKDVTGALSFGLKVFNNMDVMDSKSMSFENNGTKAKTFDASIIYQTGLRESKDAAKNGVQVKTDTSFKVAANSKVNKTVSLTIPKDAEKGIYEGYIIYTNRDNKDEIYRVPFGVNYEENGFNSFKLLQGRALSTVSQSDLNPMLSNAMFISYNLKSHVERIDYLIIDAKTNNIVGSAGLMGGNSIVLNKDNLVLAFYGLYVPFIGDQSKPFSTDPEYLDASFDVNNPHFLEPGQYKMRAVGTDDHGNTFAAETEELFFEYNNRPKFDVTVPGADSNGISEYDPATTIEVPFTGSIYDESINMMKDAGFNTLTQAANTVRYLYNRAKPNPNNNLGFSTLNGINPDGTFVDNIDMKLTQAITSVRFFGINPSGVGNYQKLPTFYFVQKGKPYVSAIPNKRNLNTSVYTLDGTNVAPEDNKVTYTLKMNNAVNTNKQTFTFEYLNKYFDIESIKVNPDLASKGTVTMTNSDAQGSTAKDYETTKKTITVALAHGESINGNVAAVDVTLRVKSGVYYDYELDMKNITSTVTDINAVTKNVEALSVESYVNPTFSKFTVSTGGEAFSTSTDFTKVTGISVTATDKNNKEYQGTIFNNSGYMGADFNNLPVTTEEFMYHIHVPGHFTINKPFNVFRKDGDVIRAENDAVPVNPAIAGDVNGDDVIDVMDALYIQTYAGTNKRASDINFDGVTDSKDLAFVEKNFGITNPTVANAPTAKKKYKGKTLESIKAELAGK